MSITGKYRDTKKEPKKNVKKEGKKDTKAATKKKENNKMLISVVNKSTLVKDADVDTMCKAIQSQLTLHVLPAWHMTAVTVTFVPTSGVKKIPGYSWVVYMIDDDTQVEGALGYHQEETNGEIDAFIMAKPILDNGGTTLVYDPKNPGQYTVSATLSHEIIEMVGDPFTNNYSDNGSTSYCHELCDAVEQIGYGVAVGGTTVSVSDFLFPSYFNPDANLALNAPFNYLKTLTKPFTMLAGGYSIVRKGGPGTEKQIFGESMPDWRRNQKNTQFSRFGRRASNNTKTPVEQVEASQEKK